MYAISPVNKNRLDDIQAIIDNKTKPVGSLGELEVLAKQLMLIQLQRVDVKNLVVAKPRLTLNKPMMLVFAGDHGINEEQVSIAPSAVTQQMVTNFLYGGAAINCFCRSNNIEMTVIDCGILDVIQPSMIAKLKPNQEASQNISQATTKYGVSFIEQRLGAGTNNFVKQAAMTIKQVEQGLAFGQQLVKEQLSQGVDIILLGEMGIANTSSASALMSSLTSFSVDECVGSGTGITSTQLLYKKALIAQAVARINPIIDANKESDEAQKTPYNNEVYIKTLLSELGGFEIVQMVGAILAAAKASIPVMVDGFIVSVAAFIANKLNANVIDYLVFSHISQEKAHQLLLNELIEDNQYNTKPLLNLGLRLGEGSGAALAFPLLKAAQNFYNDMASFEDAGVTV
jgi:nicotinate-nucleotide--dimethylbenzimidazole phosphoribosyltransferase